MTGASGVEFLAPQPVAVTFEREDLVDQDQRDERQPFELGLERALAFGLRQPRDALLGCGELDALAGQARRDGCRAGGVPRWAVG